MSLTSSEVLPEGFAAELLANLRQPVDWVLEPPFACSFSMVKSEMLNRLQTLTSNHASEDGGEHRMLVLPWEITVLSVSMELLPVLLHSS